MFHHYILAVKLVLRKFLANLLFWGIEMEGNGENVSEWKGPEVWYHIWPISFFNCDTFPNISFTICFPIFISQFFNTIYMGQYFTNNFVTSRIWKYKVQILFWIWVLGLKIYNYYLIHIVVLPGIKLFDKKSNLKVLIHASCYTCRAAAYNKIQTWRKMNTRSCNIEETVVKKLYE